MNKSRKFLSLLTNYSFEKIPVRFLQSSVGKGSIVTGLPIKTEMYFSKNLILITPKEKGLFNGLFNFYLPVVFIRDFEELNKITGISNIIKPEKVSLSAWNSIILKYERPLLFNVKYSIQINLINKNDIEKISEIKNWC
ncbi:MAG: hypothetical protein L3J66_12330 [Bacteroidales bacterium]|nr:hypothetical protein [Bacteroidales bacterium]